VDSVYIYIYAYVGNFCFLFLSFFSPKVLNSSNESVVSSHEQLKLKMKYKNVFVAIAYFLPLF
jgi:hypothetical protein